MGQIKEQNKTPEKELNKMEISDLSDAELKTLVIRMLKEPIGYFNNIKKTLAEMKVIISEIKISREPTMEWMKLRINDLEHKKKFNQKSKKKENPKKTTIG